MIGVTLEGFFLIVGIALGVFLVIAFSKPFFRSLLRRRWVAVDGRVLRTTVEEYKNTQQSTQHAVRVEYEYVYGATSRRGTAHVGHSQLDRPHAQKLAKEYPAGRALDVYVYKEEPGESKLYPGINYVGGLAVMFGAALVVFFLVRLNKLEIFS